MNLPGIRHGAVGAFDRLLVFGENLPYPTRRY